MTSGRVILIERNDIVVARHSYLRVIEENRKSSPTKRRPEVFLDETWVNQNGCVGQCCSVADGAVEPKTKSGKGSRFIVLHVGGVQGFIPGALLMFR